MKRHLTLPLVFLAAASCSKGPLTGPPQLRLGRDQCAECGMIISEERCCTAFVLEHDGTREHALFDDLGCMLDYEHALSNTRVVEFWVRDHDTKAWTAGGKASYLHTDRAKLRTPMGSGMVAYADRAAADRALALHGGHVHTYATLAAARRTYMEETFGKPKTP